jgi:hypothetical protein
MPADPVRPVNNIERPPFMVTLGLLPPYMAEDVEKAYLARVKEIRPDLGGDPKPFYEVQNAYMQAKKYVEFRGDRRGWIAKRMEEYLGVQEIIETLKKFGAEVETNSLDWLQKSFGDFAELTETILGIRLNDSARGEEFIEYLVSQRDKLLELRRLDLAGCAITDAAVRQLSVFRGLQDLNLSRTPITWEALHIVQWLPELEDVHVDGTGLGWLTRHKLAAQLRHKRKAAATLRAVHPTTVR